MANETKFFEAFEELQEHQDNGTLTAEKLEKLEAKAEKNQPAGASDWREPFLQAKRILDTEDANEFFGVGS